MTTLKEYRKLSGLKNKEIAEHMGVVIRMVHLWEKGERDISAINLHKLMTLYKADIKLSELPQLIPGLFEPERGVDVK